MLPLLAPLFAVRINELWYALPLILVVSLVYSGTRYETTDDLLIGAVRSAVWVLGFMGAIFVALWAVGLLM